MKNAFFKPAICLALVLLGTSDEINTRQADTNARTCQERLFADASSQTHRLKANINLAGEYIYVSWGTTNRQNVGDFDVYVVIIDRSGNERRLRPGKNWVNSGQYILELRFYGIMSTEVYMQYTC